MSFRQPETRRPDFIVTKYRGKRDTKRTPSKKIIRQQTKSAGFQIPTIQVDEAPPRVKHIFGPQVQNEKSLAVKEINNDVPTPQPSPVTSPVPVSKSKPGKQIYLKACKKFNLVPITTIRDSLKKRQLVCKYITLTERDVKAIALALVGNHFVREILFDNNNLCRMGAEILSEVVLHTDYISHVRISDNNLGTEGARLMCRAVANNPFIVSLDLAGNGFTEKDAKYFQALLEISEHLTELNLSHNRFMEKGAIMISKGLEKNRHLLELNLSWNHIRMRGADAIGKALTHNKSLQKLNLAWNGLHMRGARSIGQGLKTNYALKELDLQCNRMTEECLAELLKGLQNNTTLEVLRLGQNHMTSTGANTVLQHFKDLDRSGIKVLDFGDQPVHENFETLLSEILQEREIQVIYGMVWQSERKTLSADDIIEDVAFLLNSNPLTVIMECMRLQNFRLADMFQSFDTDQNSKISIHELVHGLLKINVPLRRDVLLQFLKKLDQDRDGQLDYREMRVAQKIYKKQIRSYQQKNINIEHTEIGHISKHIRSMMRKSCIKNYTSPGELSSRETSPTPSVNSSSKNLSPESMSPMLKSRDTSRLLLSDSSPRLIPRDSSPGNVLRNISPLSYSSSQYMTESSNALSPDIRGLSPELELPTYNLNRSTPLPPITVQGC